MRGRVVGRRRSRDQGRLVLLRGPAGPQRARASASPLQRDLLPALGVSEPLPHPRVSSLLWTAGPMHRRVSRSLTLKVPEVRQVLWDKPRRRGPEGGQPRQVLEDPARGTCSPRPVAFPGEGWLPGPWFPLRKESFYLFSRKRNVLLMLLG